MKIVGRVSATQRSNEGIVSLGKRNGIELAILTRTQKSTGKIIAKPVVADQVGSPTFTRDLARIIRNLVRMNARGILNVTNEGSCSWFEFAEETLRQAGRDSVLVSPMTTAEAHHPARRPSFSVLSLRA